MSATPGQKRWLAKEMIEAAQSALHHDDLKDRAERSLHIVGWLAYHLTVAENAELEELMRAPARAKPITSVSDPRVRGETECPDVLRAGDSTTAAPQG